MKNATIRRAGRAASRDGRLSDENASGSEASPRTRGGNLVVAASVAILVGTEVLALALATAWALGGIFELGPTITYGIGIGLVGLGLYVLVPFIRRVWQVEAAGVDEGGGARSGDGFAERDGSDS